MYRTSTKIVSAHTDSIWSVHWTLNNQIISGSVDEFVKVWNYENNKISLKKEYPNHTLGTISLDTNKNGTILATSSFDNQLRIFHLDSINDDTIDPINEINESEIELDKIENDEINDKTNTDLIIETQAGDLWQIAFNPTNDFHICSGSQKGKINIYDITKKNNNNNNDINKNEYIIQTIQTDHKFIMSVAYSIDGRFIACGCYNGMILIIDIESKKIVGKHKDHFKPVRSIKFSSDGSLLFSASDDMHVNIYNVHSNYEKIGTVSGHTSWILDVACSPTNKQFTTAGADRKVKIWDMNMRQSLYTFEYHTDQVWSVAYNKTGTHLVSGGDDAMLQIYEIGV